jgi:hypothetical protein
MERKIYLGDAVYAELTNYGEIKLTTENGLEATNTIVLEMPVYENLVNWINRLTAELQAQHARNQNKP